MAKNPPDPYALLASGTWLCEDYGIPGAMLWGAAKTDRRFPGFWRRNPRTSMFAYSDLDLLFFDLNEFGDYCTSVGWPSPAWGVLHGQKPDVTAGGADRFIAPSLKRSQPPEDGIKKDKVG
jgi:hypothetical protein